MFEKETEQEILQRVEDVASKAPVKDRYLDDEEFTAQRLMTAKMIWGHQDELVR